MITWQVISAADQGTRHLVSICPFHTLGTPGRSPSTVFLPMAARARTCVVVITAAH